MKIVYFRKEFKRSKAGSKKQIRRFVNNSLFPFRGDIQKKWSFQRSAPLRPAPVCIELFEFNKNNDQPFSIYRYNMKIPLHESFFPLITDIKLKFKYHEL